jgi:colicin import membrane protein
LDSKNTLSQEYGLPLTLAVGLHVVILILLSFQFFTNTKPSQPIEIIAAAPVITANAINSNEVTAEVKRLERLEQARQEKLQAEQEKIRLEKQQAEKEREQALYEVEQAKKEKEELVKKAEAEKLHLAELKKKQEEIKRKEELKKKEEAKKKAEKEKQEAEVKKAKEKELAEKKAKDAAEKKKAQQLAAAKQKAEQEALEAQEGQRVTSEVMRYQALIIQKLSQNWTVQGSVRANMQGRLQIRLAPGGSVIDVRVIASSGDEMMDRSAVTAVYRSSPLPVSTDQKVFNELRDIKWTFKPADILSTR